MINKNGEFYQDVCKIFEEEHNKHPNFITPSFVTNRLIDLGYEKINKTSEDEKEKVKCPICKYPLGMCQCCFGGSAHPDRSDREKVVLHHLYLFSDEQIRHIQKIQAFKQASYSDSNLDEILKDLYKEYNDKN